MSEYKGHSIEPEGPPKADPTLTPGFIVRGPYAPPVHGLWAKTEREARRLIDDLISIRDRNS